jgi:hypothetical protein
MASPVLPVLVITPDDRATLERWTTRRKTAQALALRSRIILRCGDGQNNSEVADDILASIARFCLRTSGTGH